MRKTTLLSSIFLLAIGGSASPVLSGEATLHSPLAQATPDNTGRNVRDREGATLTPGDQSERKADLDLTQRIRQAVVADESLSTTAQNIKIITVDGVVTLRGPVSSEQEKTKITATAQKIAGAKQVDNQLEVVKH